tara:strand:- start:536 stop:1333 length:798 start_codon:yes stop_codon:yes gene_type:complete
MADKGTIYILVNSADVNAVKVGRTNNLRRRLKEHNSASNVIGNWKVYWKIEVPDTQRAEALALASLSAWKTHGRREQFQCGAKKAKEAISIALAEWSQWGQEEKARREENLARKRLVDSRAREANRLLKAAEEHRLKTEKTLEMLHNTYPQRRLGYERAKRIVAGDEHIPYPWKFIDVFSCGLPLLGIYYFSNMVDTDRMTLIATILMTTWFYSVFFVLTGTGTRFREWKDEARIESHLGTIENFEMVYPDGVPPTNLDYQADWE